MPPRSGPLQRISLAAVTYAAALDLHDPSLLAARLYRYNALPLSPAWRRRLPDEKAAARLLALDRWTGSRRRASADAISDSYRHAVWRVWETGSAPPTGAPTFKLYVSPLPADTGEACAALLALLGRGGGPLSVKVGADAASLLRPDRLVAYFGARDACLAAGHAVAARLGGMPVQGVPFTAAIDATGLVSWAADPPGDPDAGRPRRERSWRGWVTARIAEALIAAAAARRRGAGRRPAAVVRAALARLESAGLDTVGWTACR